MRHRRDTAFASKAKPAVLDVLEMFLPERWPRSPSGGAGHPDHDGRPLAEGADAVVRVEDTEAQGGRVKIFRCRRSGLDIREAGEDVKTGELVIFERGCLRPAEIGMLAALGRSYVERAPAARRGRYLPGDEWWRFDETPGPGRS